MLETFIKAICDWVVCCCTNLVGSKELHELFPEFLIQTDVLNQLWQQMEHQILRSSCLQELELSLL